MTLEESNTVDVRSQCCTLFDMVYVDRLTQFNYLIYLIFKIRSTLIVPVVYVGVKLGQIEGGS